MPVTPTGILSLPLANLRTALSACSSFQTWTGTANAGAALAKIGLVERADLSRPFAVVDDAADFDVEMIDCGATFRDQGALFLMFEDAVASDNAASETDAQLAFTNAVGAILEELIAYCGNNRNVFSIAGASKVFGPVRSGDTERRGGQDYMQIGFMVKWR